MAEVIFGENAPEYLVLTKQTRRGMGDMPKTPKKLIGQGSARAKSVFAISPGGKRTKCDSIAMASRISNIADNTIASMLIKKKGDYHHRSGWIFMIDVLGGK
jgi:hypothetical protein